MGTHWVQVSVGLPVYNGERYLAETLDSLLRQTYTDFELIISDNGSTDGTADICRRYAVQDRRIRYLRSDRNMGCSWNFNRVFHEARGRYFHWHGHDDPCEPDLLRRCVEVLDRDPGVVLAYPRAVTIDEHGQMRGDYRYNRDASAPSPPERFLQLITTTQASPPCFGLIRADVLRKTPVMGDYAGTDLVLLAELSLHGRFEEVPEVLLYAREHSERSVRANPSPYLMTVFQAPQREGELVFPGWRMMAEFAAAVQRAPLDWRDRLLCYRHVAACAFWYRGWLASDLLNALRGVRAMSPAPRSSLTSQLGRSGAS